MRQKLSRFRLFWRRNALGYFLAAVVLLASSLIQAFSR